ncbi:MAG: hypothetical protein A3G84_06310 [Chloroflexi bacterium RIFCSPLOWO2_12_FULL_71_12]|nr:MAG: hypothetical protein A3G84_06310 [Chloroflexi bacterium RIFCSPLOWO2_12_FULL_71_12]
MPVMKRSTTNGPRRRTNRRSFGMRAGSTYAKICQTMMGIAMAMPANSATRMNVAKPSVGASVMHEI